jgi:molybdopterin/thiamine biosynthesis adenylyltransferase
MTKADYLRQSGIISIQDFKDNEIAIIGCGAIGSFTAISLAKMGLQKFFLCDMDRIEPHNLPNQFFKEEDIGVNKVFVTSENMKDFNSDVKTELCYAEIEKNKTFPSKSCTIVVSCVDNMDVRKYIFNKCKKNKQVQLFIDTRMAGLQGQVYIVDMSNKKQIKNYEKSLFKTEDAVQLRCTERSIIFTVMGIASLVCNQVLKALKGEELSNFIVLDYNLPQMF